MTASHFSFPRPLFDAPQGDELLLVTPFVPTPSMRPSADPLSGQAVGFPAGVALTVGSTGAGLTVPDRGPPLLEIAVRAVFRLVQRHLVAEGVLVGSGALCVLAGLPAPVTAFVVALVGFVVNTWVAVRTLGPVVGKMMRRRNGSPS